MALVIALAMVLTMMSMSAFAKIVTDYVETDTYVAGGEWFSDSAGENQLDWILSQGDIDAFYTMNDHYPYLKVETEEPDDSDPDDPDEPVVDNTVGSIQLTDEPETFKDSHNYQVYQIFTGTLENGVLSNVKYGANYGSTGSSVPKTELNLVKDARKFAEDLIANNQLDGDPVAVLSADNFKAENLAPGYYLIVDTVGEASTNPADLADGDVFSQYIVQVLGNVTLATKKDVTQTEKIITADDHEDEDEGPNPGISDDMHTDNVSIGDTVTFSIIADVPSHAADYDYYYFIINDTLSPGLTMDPSTLTVKVTQESDDPADLTAGEDYELYLADALDEANAYKTPSDGHTFEVALLNAKEFAGQHIYVSYTATLNEDAVIGGEGNLNTENVTYSNNPNQDYDGSQDSNNPGKPKSDSPVPVGTTPDSVTQTFTSGVKLQKLDQDNLALSGAKFTIEGDSINKVVTNTETFTRNDAGEYWKLKTNSYTTDAPITEDRMDTLTDAEAGDDGYVLWSEGDTEDKVTVGGVNYRVVRENEIPAYILIKKNSDLYASTTEKYTKTTTETVEETTEHISDELEVNADGTLNLEGLGAGIYTITETAAPDGYSKAEPVSLVITFDNETKKFTATINGEDATADATTNLFPIDVVNVAGHELPSTGGIGTTIFYVVGALLVLGAGVVLITRRRMDA